MADSNRKESLIAELADARDRLAGHGVGLRRSVSLTENLKRGVRHHPAAWFGGAALVGLLLSRIPPGRTQVKVKRPALGRKEVNVTQAGKAAFAATIFKFGLDLAKPGITRWLRERVGTAAGFTARTSPAAARPQASAPAPMALSETRRQDAPVPIAPGG